MVCRCSAPADWRTNGVERIQIVTLLIRVQYLQTTRALTSLTSTGEIKPCEEIFSLFFSVYVFFFNPPRPWLSLCRRSERCTSSCSTRCFRASIFFAEYHLSPALSVTQTESGLRVSEAAQWNRQRPRLGGCKGGGRGGVVVVRERRQ